MESEKRQAIAHVLGRVPSGIWILTVRDQSGRETGMLTSWVQQASFEPPMVTVAVNRERFINDWLRETGGAALSLLGESHKQFMVHFGRGFEPHEEAFEDINISRGLMGIPVLTDAIGYMEGNITASFPAGDHIIYLLEILEAGIGPGLGMERPMVHIRKNGFRY